MYKTVPQNVYFLPRDLVMIFQNLVMILPRFFDFERPWMMRMKTFYLRDHN